MRQHITTTTDPIIAPAPRPPTLGHSTVRITDHPTRHESFCIGLFHTPASKKIGIINRDGFGHSMLQGDGANLVYRSTADGGTTVTDPVVIRTEAGTDYGGLVFATTPAGKWIAVASRIQYIAGKFCRLEPVCLTSTNEGTTWSATIVPGITGLSIHSQLTPYKGDGFGSDTSWICYGFRTEPGNDPDFLSLWYLRTLDDGATWDAGEVQVRDPGDESSEFTVAHIGTPEHPNRWVMIGRNDTGSGSMGNARLWTSTDLIAWDGPHDTGQATGAAMGTLIAHDDTLWWYNPVRHIKYGYRPRDTWQVQDATFDDVWADPVGCWPGWTHLTNTTPGLIGYGKYLWVDGALYFAYGSDETEGTQVGANIYLARPDMPSDDAAGGLLNILREPGDIAMLGDDGQIHRLPLGADGTVLTPDRTLSPIPAAWKIPAGGGGEGTYQSPAKVQELAVSTASGVPLVFTPAAPTPGNVLLALVGSRANPAPFTPPSGFTLIHTIGVSGSAWGYAYVKVADGTETSLTFTPPATSLNAGILFEFSGTTDTLAAATVVHSSGSSTVKTLAIPPVSITEPAMLIAFTSMNAGSGSTTPTTFTNLALTTGTGLVNRAVHAGYAVAAAGSHGTTVDWFSAARAGGAMLALTAKLNP